MDDRKGPPVQGAKILMKRVSPFLFAVVLATLCGCGGGGSGTVSLSTPPPGTGIPGIDSIRQEFLDAVNQARSVGRMCGATSYPAAPPVAWSDFLAMAAYLHSEDMAINESLTHTGSDGSTPGERIDREGYDWWTYGENIAVGYPTVSAVMQGWLDSEGHCSNIMNSAFAEIGAAFAEGQYQGNPSALYWTFDLATHR
ncbi:MAG: CAP domain-containing protein [Candidatus Deferrimicrobiaceae bacterium]